MSSNLRHTTQSVPAYEPEHDGIRRGWRFVIAALFVMAVASLSLHPVCRPDVAGANESAFGVRHAQRGSTWLHCEPWLQQALFD